MRTRVRGAREASTQASRLLSACTQAGSEHTAHAKSMVITSTGKRASRVFGQKTIWASVSITGLLLVARKREHKKCLGDERDV